MIICNIHWIDQDGNDQHYEAYSVREAKQVMKQHPGSTGSKIKVYSDGEWVNCGSITLKGFNKSFIANSPRNMKKSNY